MNKMRIALVGNMNNNHFSLMRYLRHLRLDAYLFLYKNEQDHFLPENDSWEIDIWNNFIIQTDLYNGLEKGNIDLFQIKSSYIKNLFKGYDFIISNGSFPIYARRAGILIDLFIPYGVGVELLGKKNDTIAHFISSRLIRYLQLNGLKKNTKNVVSIDTSKENLKNISSIGHNQIILGIPMVYNLEPSPNIPNHLEKYIKMFQKASLVLFSHVSHIWKNLPSNWKISYKKNDVLIRGYARYLKSSTFQNSILVLLEYGPDVDESKNLISLLGIKEKVIWIPQMSRKEIMLLLEYVDIGGGELGGLIWGGTGWEFMSKGIPFFQYVKQTPAEYQLDTGHPFPDILNVQTEKDIEKHLLNFELNQKLYTDTGIKLRNWFEEYGGLGLAKKYKDLILDNYQQI